MKKITLSVVLSAVFCLILSLSAFADSQVTESPNVKIIIDGKTGEYQNTPIVVQDRTMLPFREVLVNLGIPNDDQHIIWDEANKSITIIADQVNPQVKIKLTIDSDKAYVNDKEQTLPIAPIIYNDSTYIPVRFISDALNKKVVWDGSFEAVFIRDEKDFNDIKNILDKVNAVYKDKYKTYSMTGDMLMNMKMDGLGAKTDNQPVNIESKSTFNGDVDLNNKLMYMDISMLMNSPVGLSNKDVNIKMKMYFDKNALYTNMDMDLPKEAGENPFKNQWIKQEYDDATSNQMFNQSNNLSQYTELNMNESTCAGMILEESKDGKSFVLKGNVYMQSILDQAFKNSSSLMGSMSLKPTIKEAYMEMYINKDTYTYDEIKANIKMTMDLNSNSSTESEKALNIKYDYDINADYNYDYSKEINIVLPEETKNAVLMENLLKNISK